MAPDEPRRNVRFLEPGRPRPALLRAAVLAGLGLAGCAKQEAPAPPPPAVPATAVATAAVATAVPAPAAAAFAVGSVTLGNAIGADKKVVAPLEVFGVKDRIFASVESTGQGHAKLRALWSFVKAGRTAKVSESTIEFDATGPLVNELHVGNKLDWPKGDYRVEIFLGDGAAPVVTRTFKVQ